MTRKFIRLLGIILCVSCSAQEPEKYPGNVDGIKYLIPGKVLLLPARYEGEDDWTPPLKPHADRTFADRLSMAELGTFETSGLASNPDPVGTKKLEGGILGAIQVAYSFFPRGWNEENSIKKGMYFPDLLTNPHAMSDQFGLTVRQSDRMSSHYNYNQDRDYKSKDGFIWIICANNNMVVAPFSKLPDTCVLRGIDINNRAEIQVHLPAKFLISWAEIFRRASDILSSWRLDHGKNARNGMKSVRLIAHAPPLEGQVFLGEKRE